MKLLCYYFSNTSDLCLFFSYIISLVEYFFARGLLFVLIFSFASCNLGCDDRCSELCWDSWFCLYYLRPCVCLYWHAPSWWVKSIKYLVLSPRTLRAFMDSIALYSKIYAFGVTLSPILRQVFMESVTKSPFYPIFSRFGSTFRKHDKLPSIWQRIFSCVLNTCSKLLSVT